jgi:hypothetical protein
MFTAAGTVVALSWFVLKRMQACSATFTLLEAPIALTALAGHLATRRDFILYPCQANALSVLQLVAQPYGYDTVFHTKEEIVCLRYRGNAQRCVCGAIGDHLSMARQFKLSLRGDA